MSGINIYIGNMPYRTTEADLIELFGRFGPVVKVTIVTERETGRSKGYGFVEMAEHDDGRQAIDTLGGKPFQGRPLTVNEARPRGSGTGERVLGDGSGGTNDEKKTAAAGDDGSPASASPAAAPAEAGYTRRSEPAPEAPRSRGYSNNLLRR